MAGQEAPLRPDKDVIGSEDQPKRTALINGKVGLDSLQPDKCPVHRREIANNRPGLISRPSG